MKTKTLLVNVASVLALPIFALQRMLPSRSRPRYSHFETGRIGHFAGDLMIVAANIEKGGCYKNCYFYIPVGKKTNRYLVEVAKRKVKHGLLAVLFMRTAAKLPWLRDMRLKPPMETVGTRDCKGETLNRNLIGFTEGEDKVGLTFLRKQGWDGERKIVVLLGRDQKYLQGFNGSDYSYHDYRNVKIGSYQESVKWLIEECGCFVVRMGRDSEERLEINSLNFIDYSFCDQQSDFLDIWMFARADLILSCGSGLDWMGGYVGVPMMLINHLPVSIAYSFLKCYYMPKKLIDGSGLRLSINQMARLHFLRSGDYEKNQLEVVDLDSKEILEGVMEGWRWLIERQEPPEDQMRVREDVSSILKSEYPTLHGEINPEFYISSFVVTDESVESISLIGENRLVGEQGKCDGNE